MQVEVYADVVFFINLVMDFFIFLIVAKLAKKIISYKRIILGSIVASILYCFIIFIPALQSFYNFFGAILILIIATMLTFKPTNVKELLKFLFLSHVSAFAIGGAGMALFYYTNLSNTIGNMLSFSIKNFPFKILLIATATSYIVIKLSLNWIKAVFSKTKVFYNVKIYFNDKQIDLNALVDTGNSLYDPTTNEPVIVAEFSVVKQLLPDAIKMMYYEDKENDLNTIVCNLDNTKFKIRMIPFSSLGVRSGMLIGFKPDIVEIQNNDNKQIFKNIIIAIYNYNLSKDGTYQALINPEIFENDTTKIEI